MPATILSEADARREAAIRALWSNHPLIHAYRAENLCDDVPLPKLIAFVQQMPKSKFNACMLQAR